MGCKVSLLIEPEILATLLNDSKVVLLDARFSLGLAHRREGQMLYDQGHIPGAVYADLEDDLSGAIILGQTGRHPLPDKNRFTATLRRWGVDEQSQVIIYDDGGHAMAARAWWLLRWAGVHKVCLLHGGVKAWLAARYPMTIAKPFSKPSLFTPAYSGMPTMSAAQLLPLLDSGQITLIDARGKERFRGEIEPLDNKAGHIPGAVCHPFSGNMDEQGRFFAPERLGEQFDSIVRTDTIPVFYCGSGVTACHNIFAMEYAGFKNSVLYPGSWSEWINNPDHPISVGQ